MKAVFGWGGRLCECLPFLTLSGLVALCVTLQYQFYGEWLLRFPLFVLILLFLILVIYNRFGQDYGLSHLFWHQCPGTQIRMGIYVSALLALQWSIAYDILRDFDGDKQFRDMARFRDQALIIPHSFWNWFHDSPHTRKDRAAGIEHHREERKAAGFKPVHNPHGSFRWWPVDENEFRIANYEPPPGSPTAGGQGKEREGKDKEETGGAPWPPVLESNVYAARLDLETFPRTARPIFNRYVIFFVFTYLPSLALLALAIFPPIARKRVQGSETVVRGAGRGWPFVLGMFLAASFAFGVICACPSPYAWTFQQHWLQEAVYHFQTTVVTILGAGDNDRTLVTRGFPYYIFVFLATFILLIGNHGITSRKGKFRLAPTLDYVILGLLGITFLLAVLQVRVWFPDPSGAAKIADWRAVEMIVNIFLLTVIVGLVFYAMKFIYRRQTSPNGRRRLNFVTSQGAICIMLAFVTTIYGTFVQIAWLADVEGMPVLQGILLLPLIAYLMSRNSDRFKLRFPGMVDYYEHGESGPNAAKLQDYYHRNITGNDRPIGASGKTSDNDELFDNDEALKNWHDIVAKPSEAGAQKPKLAIVAVSGGSIRSGVWTAKVLTELEQHIPGFQHHLRLITGASGGMIGATLYAAAMQRPDPGNTDSGNTRRSRAQGELEGLVQRLNHDCLHPVACQLALGDLPAIFSSSPPSQDRGKALEQAWEELSAGMLSESSDNPLGSLLCQPVASLAEGESQGWRPSLIFSPMLAEDGRRLLISNLDLKFLTRSEGPFLLDEDSRCLKQHGVASEDLYSLSAYQFFRLFPKARRTFKLSTAIRMSASFPYISPAVNLPTIPPRRVVDAGYYDNYGVNIAVSWITHHRHWLLDHTSGVVLIQVRAFESPREIETAKPNEVQNRRDEARHFRSWKNSLHWLTTPIAAALKARSAGMSFRNDEQIAVLASTLREESPDDGPQPFFQTISFDCNATASLNWYITESEFDGIVGCLAPDTNNWKRLETLKAWWGAEDMPPPPPSGAEGANCSSTPNPTPSEPPVEAVPFDRSHTQSTAH